MEEPLKFQFELQRTPFGPLVEVSSQEMEKLLLKKLEESENNPTQALWQLALFYKQTRQNGKALTRLQEILPLMPDPGGTGQVRSDHGTDHGANGQLRSGHRLLQTGAGAGADAHLDWYFINNNLGFSLNIMERFAEAEPYCRRAMQSDPNRPNAYKNLGLSLAGQGQYREAAQCYVAATQINAADPRAFHLLMDLVKNHPELEYDFETAAACCRKAVETAARKVEAMKPVIHRGWKKQFILFRAKLWAMIRRLWTGSPSETTGTRL